MQSSHVQNPLTISHLKLLSTLFKSTFTSHPNPLPRFIPDHPIFPLIESAQAHPHTDPRPLHAHTITSGLIRDPFAASRVIQLLLLPGPAADLRYATAVFNSLHHPDVYTWNAMIAAHADQGFPDSAVAFYFCMRATRAPPNTYTFALLVKACIHGGDTGKLIGLGKEVHGQILKCGVEDVIVVKNSLLNMYCGMDHLAEARLLFDKSWHLDLISWNTLISAYGKNGDVVTAGELFERMPERSLVSWSAMIDGYVRNGDFSMALRLFDEMQDEGMEPDVVTLVSVLKACAQLGALDQGCRIHHYIDRNGLAREGNVILETALVDMYCKCGCMDEALKVFDGVRGGDVVLWNAMIGGLAMHGHAERALELFGMMKERGIIPNESTFIGALCACTHAGMVNDGKKIFESMREYGVEPQREHYGCLADLLGRAGQVEEAEQVLLSMPMEPQASQWGALMSACRTHHKIDVGERVGKHLISLEPYDGGRYVLMANMYAINGQWDDAGGMRRAMEEIGAKKETGRSFIE
ncbi:pentatricopeptide repeat-containing protein At5g66520 [Elaeis guineensis]|uniref:Pentatricopeptide repeat-containing protein At5g66520-like n=1 Tax=Elaeis guineensis var. tenera TaxID=51953 RepID=A0A8N4EX47_ELAGV|nr:pentatricopeptide repeat-containing protein At5g66520-like [Elaeis guineensis]